MLPTCMHSGSSSCPPLTLPCVFPALPLAPPPGGYDGEEGWRGLAATLNAREQRARFCGNPCGRLYYLALPPSVYPQVCDGLKVH